MTRAVYFIEDRSVLDLLGRIQSVFSGAGRAAIFEEIGRRASPFFVFDYPAATGAKMSDLWTPRQRRGFFAKKAKGEITVPHPRTGGLGRAIKTWLTIVEDRAVLTVGIPDSDPRSKYAKYIIGLPSEQSRYFGKRTGWKPLLLKVQEKMREFQVVLKAVIESVIKDLGGLDGASR